MCNVVNLKKKIYIYIYFLIWCAYFDINHVNEFFIIIYHLSMCERVVNHGLKIEETGRDVSQVNSDLNSLLIVSNIQMQYLVWAFA